MTDERWNFVLRGNDPNRDVVRANLSAAVDRLPATKSWRVEIKPEVKTRTDPQNRALFGVAYPVLEAATGYTKDELHAAFCRRFFGTTSINVMGQTLTRPVRTTTTDEDGRRDVISRLEFMDFYSVVQMVGAEIGVYVPDPEPEGMPA